MAKPPRRSSQIKRAVDVQDPHARGRIIAPGRRASNAPELFDEPLPGFLEPCLATLKEQVPAGEKWVHEIKWDGYWLMVRIDYGEVTILTRRGHDWTDRFPAIRDAAKALPVRTALIDGEAVVCAALSTFVKTVHFQKTPLPNADRPGAVSRGCVRSPPATLEAVHDG